MKYMVLSKEMHVVYGPDIKDVKSEYRKLGRQMKIRRVSVGKFRNYYAIFFIKVFNPGPATHTIMGGGTGYVPPAKGAK